MISIGTLTLFVAATLSTHDTFLPRVVWSFYDRSDDPTIKIFYQFNNEHITGKYTYRFLTLNNLSLYLDVSSFPLEFHWVSSKKQSDYIRISLLSTYGGWWIDASTLVSNVNYLDEIVEQVRAKSAVGFGYGTQDASFIDMQAGVMYAPWNSSLFHSWKSEFEKALHIGQMNYIYEQYLDGVGMNRCLMGGFPRISTYFITTAAQQTTIQRYMSREARIITIPPHQGMYQLPAICQWNMSCISTLVMEELSHPKFNITKLNGHARTFIWPRLKQDEQHYDIEQHSWDPFANNHFYVQYQYKVRFVFRSVIVLVTIYTIWCFYHIVSKH